MDIKEKKKQRFEFLKKLYETTNGDRLSMVQLVELGIEIGMNEETSYSVARFLDGEGLAKIKTMDGYIAITHSGVMEVEDAMENPEKATEHFLPVSIINVQTMTNSVIQQNSPGGIQNITFGTEEKADLKSFLEEVKQSLDKLNLAVEDQNELIAEMGTVEAQVNSPKPKSIILNESLKTIRSILESVAANAYTPILLEKLGHLMNGFGG